MRRLGFILPGALIAVLVVGIWGLWTHRLSSVNREMALDLEAERQRNFADMAYHVQEIQTLLGKGLVTGSVRQNMRYMGDVHHHAMSAVSNFGALPLPPELGGTIGKFLKQTGDFAGSLMRNEAAGRDMDEETRDQLAFLTEEATNLNAQLQHLTTVYHQGGFRWVQPMRFTWANLLNGEAAFEKPAGTDAQAPASMVPGGMEAMGESMQQFPAFVYDGPFADGLNEREPAMSGESVSQEEAQEKLRQLLPNGEAVHVVGVEENTNNLPTWSFMLSTNNRNPAADMTYTSSAEVAQNGGYLVNFLTSRLVGNPTIGQDQAEEIAQEYLASLGYLDMEPTYFQLMDGTITITFAYHEGDVVVYPDQIKVKVALDNGEIMAMSARQYLMNHHDRSIGTPKVSAEEARKQVNGNLSVERVQLTIIPNLAGNGEHMAWEFLTTHGNETFLVYINAETGHEEQILQKIQTDGGTFAM